MSALGANRTRRDSGHDVNDPERSLGTPTCRAKPVLEEALTDDDWTPAVNGA